MPADIPSKGALEELDEQMHLSGQLKDWSIDDLLQIMQVTQKTGSLDIDGERHGRIHFKDGAVTGAELTGSGGSYLGSDRGGIADVLYVLSALSDGSFAVGPADGPDAPGWSVEDVTADVEALQSLEGEVIDAGLFDASQLRLTHQIDGPIQIEPADWATLVSLVQPFTFDELEAKLGRGGAIRLFHTLHRLGVADAQAVEEEDANWLDKIADDVAPEPESQAWAEESEEAAEDPSPMSQQEEAPAPQAEEVHELPAVVEIDGDDEDVRGVAAPASTMLTDGVYDEIRRLRSKVAEK